MSISVTDFINGVDFDGYGTQTAQMHNQLVSLGTVWTDKGLVMRSVDTALNVPDVPNATSTTKWKRYIWLRIPHSTSASTVPMFYAWNDSATSVATYLKWQRIQADFTTVNATIAALQAELDASQLDITANGLTANAASSLASTASNNSTLALANAATVAGNLSTLNAQVNHVTTGLAPTKAIADSALSLATAAVTSVQLTTALAPYTTINNERKLIVSDLYTITSGATVSIAHGFGVVPKTANWVIVCITNQTPYVVGDELPIGEVGQGGGNPYQGFTSIRSATELKVTTTTYQLQAVSAYLTNANWKLKCYYSKE